MRRSLSITIAACIAAVGATTSYAGCCGGGGNASSGGYGGGGFIGAMPFGDGSPRQVAMKVWGYYIRYYKNQFDDLHEQEDRAKLENGSRNSDFIELKTRERGLEDTMIRKLRNGRVRLTRDAAEVMIDYHRS